MNVGNATVEETRIVGTWVGSAYVVDCIETGTGFSLIGSTVALRIAAFRGAAWERGVGFGVGRARGGETMELVEGVGS